MKTCYVLIGVSGSGKSTFLKNYLDRPGVVVSSLDTYRLDMFDQIVSDPKKAYAEAFKFANENAKRFDDYVTKRWNEDLKNAETLFVDNTNLTRKSRARWINEARSKGFKIVGVQFYTPLQVVLDRQASRTDKFVPLDVVRDMYMRVQEVMLGTEVDSLMIVDGTDATRAVEAVMA